MAGQIIYLILGSKIRIRQPEGGMKAWIFGGSAPSELQYYFLKHYYTRIFSGLPER
jgi:hypothetical protein